MPAPQIQQIATEYKPWGLTAGAMVGQQQYDTEAANLQALNEARLANVGHQKDAMLAQGQMDNPAWLQSKIAGEIGQGQSLAATGEYDKGVLQSKLAAGIAKNLEGKSESEYKQVLAEGSKHLYDLNLANIRLNSPEAQNPAILSEVLQQIGPSLGFPPEVQGQLLKVEQQQPGTIKKAIAALTDQMRNAVSITPQVYAKMQEDNNKVEQEADLIHTPANASHERVAAGNNATSIRVAEINAASRAQAKSKLTIIEQLIKTGRYEAAATGLSLMAMDSQDPAEKQQLLQQAAMYEQMAKEKAAAGAVKPDAISQSAVSGLPGQQQSPSRILNQSTQSTGLPPGVTLKGSK